MMALSGVRSSWLTLETNCDLCLVAPAKLATLVLDFVEKPHVLDRDRRLVREGRDQLDLLVGERLNGAARQDQHASRRVSLISASALVPQHERPCLGVRLGR